MSIPKPITARQMKKLASLVTGAIPSDLSSELARKWIDSKRDLEETIRRILLSRSEYPKIAEINWKIVYELIGMNVEYESTIHKLIISNLSTIWTIPVLRGLTCKKVIACLKKLGVDVKKDINNPDEEVGINTRNPRKGSYAVNFRRSVEADEENRNLSAGSQRDQRGQVPLICLPLFLSKGSGTFVSKGSGTFDLPSSVFNC